MGVYSRLMLIWLSPVLSIALASQMPIGPNISGKPTDPPCEGAAIDQNYCYRCHSKTAPMMDFGFDLWRVDDLIIGPENYNSSNHAKLNCLDCHGFTWPFFPHSDATLVGGRDMACLECHKDQKKFGKYRFGTIEQEFHQSVHGKRLQEFSCLSCHDPHKFDIPDPDREIRVTVEHSNNICLKCHLSSALFSNLTNRPRPVLEESHDWLPNPQSHWDHVRCVECHTPHEAEFSHRILKAKSAERLCVMCHTRDSILLTTLYKHRINENRERAGFTNSVVFNEAYIIGMTRNVYLDWASNLLFLCTVLGIMCHALLRIVASKRRKHGK